MMKDIVVPFFCLMAIGCFVSIVFGLRKMNKPEFILVSMGAWGMLYLIGVYVAILVKNITR